MIPMSNYLFACGESKIISEISKWFEKGAQDTSEASMESLSNGYDIYCISKSSTLQRTKDSVSFMQGWIRDHTTSSMILGQEGYTKWRKDSTPVPEQSQHIFEGTYVQMSVSENSVTVRNDLFCLFPVVYFVEKNLFVCSDSLYIVTELRKMLSLPCTQNEKVLYSRSWLHGLACAPMGNETQIKDVHLLSPGKEISLRFKKNKDSTDSFCTNNFLIQKNLHALFEWESHDYEQSLRKITAEFIQSIISFGEIQNLHLNLSLSGGLDSRLILAVILNDKSLFAKTKITTNVHQTRKDDFEIVSLLSNKFGFEFNNSERVKDHLLNNKMKLSKIHSPFSLWILSSMGLFDMMYLHDSYWEYPYVVDIGGHGAEIVKGTFTNVKISNLIYKRSYFGLIKNRLSNFSKIYLSRKKLKKIKTEIKCSLRSSGVDINELGSFQWHHMCYKSPIQNGRFLSRTSLSSRPYMQRSLFAFAVSPTNSRRFSNHNGNSVVQDMLIILNPELAKTEFTNNKYNVTGEYVDKRLLELGGAFDQSTVTPYRIYGGIKSLRNGPPKLFLEKVKSVFPTAKKRIDSILYCMEEVWRQLSKEQKQIYKEAYETATLRLASDNAYVPNAGTPAAKIISLMLLDHINLKSQ